MKTTILATLVVALLLTGCGGAKTAARTPEGIVAAYKAAGLEAESPTTMGPGDYGPAPYVAKGVRFLIPSMCADCGGRAFVGTKEEITQLRSYYEEMGKASALLFSWVFVTPDGKAMVQINGELPEDQAKKYEEALK
jgi:hypothetical protein